MTGMMIFNLILTIAVVAGLVTVCRTAYVVAGRKPEEPKPVEAAAPGQVSELGQITGRSNGGAAGLEPDRTADTKPSPGSLSVRRTTSTANRAATSASERIVKTLGCLERLTASQV